MKYIALCSTIIASIAYSTLSCDPVITLFIKPYPHATPDAYAHHVNNNLKNVGGIARNSLRGMIQPCIASGIFSTYAGFLNVSDCNGQIQFPRKQEHPVLHMLLTDQITPIIMSGMTIHHWELGVKTPAHLYRLEQQQDPETHLYYWQATDAPLPDDAVIPLDTIIVFANPHDIYLPLGITLTDNTPNFVLPPLYLKKDVDINTLDLYVLNVKHFFAALDFLYNKQETGYSSLLLP